MYKVHTMIVVRDVNFDNDRIPFVDIVEFPKRKVYHTFRMCLLW